MQEHTDNEVLVACDASARPTPLVHAWEHTIGSGHATLALRADYQAQLRRCRLELGMRRVRFHGILSDDVGTLMCEQHRLKYCFYNAEAIWDALLAIDVRPFVELSFVPTELASATGSVFHYRANVTPPADVSAWAELIRRLAAHCVARYGRSEVEQWLFEVWNEPNLSSFWRGTQAQYFALYHATATTLKSVSDSLQVGGPVTASNAWITDFLDYCTRHDAPLDFVSTHYYPTDAFGKPGDDTEAQLAASARSVLRDRARATRQLVGSLPLYYTEWSTSSNPRDALHDEPYAAPVIVKTMLEARGLVNGYSWWTFSDIFEENYFPSSPFQGGFGLLTIYGVPKPSYRAFELLHRLGTELIYAMEDVHPTVDAWVVRQPDGMSLTIMLTNHALPRHPIETRQVRVELRNMPPPAAVTVRRIDNDHANAKARWIALGSPLHLTPAQVEDLEDVSRLARQHVPYTYDDGTVSAVLDLPAHSVAAISIDVTAHAPNVEPAHCA